MALILTTIFVFAVVAALIYAVTELLPRWRFQKRHRLHRSTLEQFDITRKDDHIDGL